MQLKRMKFTRLRGEPNEWSIEGRPQQSESHPWVSFENMNLIVGKNASGKSRTINAIRHVADLVSGDINLSDLDRIGFGTARYDLEFEGPNGRMEYSLEFKKGKVIDESLKLNQNTKLDRTQEKLWFEKEERNFAFKVDDGVLAVVSKRDELQHPFLQDLYDWGKNLNLYRFGTQLGKNALLKDIDAIQDDPNVDLKDGDEVTEIFIKGKKYYSNDFVKEICDDMERIFYSIETIDADKLENFPFPFYGLNVKERDIDGITDQRAMSQGMFRALSLLIQLNYSLRLKESSCILIDDIGEGLDYERSKGLIDLIIEKVSRSPDIQVIMTTNDRFAMNKVPLKFWSVIQRTSNKSLFYNYQNSKETFDQFEEIGLSNFDFLATDFYLTDTGSN